MQPKDSRSSLLPESKPGKNTGHALSMQTCAFQRGGPGPCRPSPPNEPRSPVPCPQRPLSAQHSSSSPSPLQTGLTSSLLLACAAQTHVGAEERPVPTPPRHGDGSSPHPSIQISAHLFCFSLIGPRGHSPQERSRNFPASRCLTHSHTHQSQQRLLPRTSERKTEATGLFFLNF